jgi:hypothetical protein
MNRKGLCLAAAVVVAIYSNTVASANQLTNPGFEIDAVLNAPPIPGFATDWTQLFNNAAVASTDSSDPNLYPVRTGIGSLQLPGGGGFGVPGAYVTFPAKPGQVWDLQGYGLTPAMLPADATFGLLKIVFGDGLGDLPPAAVNIGQAGPAANPGIEGLPLLNSASTPNTWQFMHAQGVAPAGTTEVKLFALFVDQSAGTGYFDDLEALLAGDFDNDKDIDAVDLPIWTTAFGMTGAGDADGDHDSDGADLLLWQRALDPPTMIASAVPEPTAAVLLALAAGLTVVRRR